MPLPTFCTGIRSLIGELHEMIAEHEKQINGIKSVVTDILHKLEGDVESRDAFLKLLHTDGQANTSSSVADNYTQK